ncbi:MAG: hypothetical protein AB9873_03240 [Syntrophobacteraceae bacterium]
MDRVKQLEEEVKQLQERLAELHEAVRDLKADFLAVANPVEALLAQRGYSVRAHSETARLLSPPNLSRDGLDSFYRLMRRYSFRLFLRELIQFPSGESVGDVSRYCSPGTARSYLASLSLLGIARMDPGGGYELIPRHVISFGPTLEWYVCEVLRREFLAPALSSVRLQATREGGDYDVIAFLDRRLVYVEVKSSPPRGIERPAMSAFLKRVRELQPDVAIFLVDTHLRMKDKIVPMLEEAIADAAGGTFDGMAVQRLLHEIFHFGHALYVANSRNGIYSNLKVCVQDHLRSPGKIRLPGWN